MGIAHIGCCFIGTQIQGANHQGLFLGNAIKDFLIDFDLFFYLRITVKGEKEYFCPVETDAFRTMPKKLIQVVFHGDVGQDIDSYPILGFTGFIPELIQMLLMLFFKHQPPFEGGH